MKVQLTFYEMLQGAHAGIMRQVENLKLQREAAHGAGVESDWQLNVEGCLGEIALAKHLGVYWSGKGQFRGADVGTVQCRTTKYHGGHLLLHEEDCDDDQFWLVTGLNGHYIVRGWILGANGKIEKFWGEPSHGRPCFMVPQSELTLD